MKCDGKTAAQWAAHEGHQELAKFIESWGMCARCNMCFPNLNTLVQLALFTVRAPVCSRHERLER